MSEDTNTGIFILELKELPWKYVKAYHSLLKDGSISLRAKGLHTFLRTFPSGWKFRVRDLCKRVKEGRTAITAALRELEEKGYITKDEIPKVNGRYCGYLYTIYCIRQDKYSKKIEEGDKIEVKH